MFSSKPRMRHKGKKKHPVTLDIADEKSFRKTGKTLNSCDESSDKGGGNKEKTSNNRKTRRSSRLLNTNKDADQFHVSVSSGDLKEVSVNATTKHKGRQWKKKKRQIDAIKTSRAPPDDTLDNACDVSTSSTCRTTRSLGKFSIEGCKKNKTKIKFHSKNKQNNKDHQNNCQQMNLRKLQNHPRNGCQTPVKKYKRKRRNSNSATSQYTEKYDIPGYFFDEKKKKYFRILPSHKNVNSGIVTRETVKLVLSEEQRERDLENIGAEHVKSFLTNPVSKQISNSSEFNGNASVKLLRGKSYNLVHNLTGFSMGELQRHCAVRLLKYNRIMTLQPQKEVLLEDCENPHSQIDNIVKMAVSHSGTVMCLWSLRASISQRIQVLNFDVMRKVDESGTWEIKAQLIQRSSAMQPIQRPLFFASKSVSTLTWAPATPDDQSDSNVLLALNPHGFGIQDSTACLYNFQTGTGHQSYTLGRELAWTCAWNPYAPSFSAGRETHSVVIDANTRKLWEVYSNKSHVYAQAFSNQNGNYLYSGTKKGDCFTHDLRSSSVRPVSFRHHKSGICYLHVSPDDRYITVAEFDGKLKKIDLRQNSTVVEYIGHKNTYHRIPFSVNNQAEYLCAVGMDSYTRLWDYQNGTLLHTIPPPHAASIGTRPAAAYVDNLNPSPGNTQCHLPCLIICTKNTVKVYTN